MIQNRRLFAMVIETHVRRCLEMKTIPNWQQKALAKPALPEVCRTAEVAFLSDLWSIAKLGRAQLASRR